MSAIWGCIDLSGKEIEENLPDKMSECTKKYKIDRVEHHLKGNVYMACGIQYFTKESRNERLPYEDSSIVFTADCIIDNRDQLIKEFGKLDSTTDGELLICSWKKWKENFGEHVLGLFSFAVYDKEKNIFYLYTDHTSSRCIHYYYVGSRVYFGTLTSCITDAVTGIKISEKWMAGCMSNNSMPMILFDGLSPFEGIYIIEYGCGIKAKYASNELSVIKRRYWDPLNDVKETKTFDDDECRRLFRDVHYQCVKDAIRTDGDVGILLSSGLDSSSIGCVAAKQLASQDKNLRSYTSIPIKGFEDKAENKDDYWIDNESDGVKSICSHYSNIIPTFMDCEGKSVLTYVEEYSDYFEFPGKSYINHVWITEAYKTAKADGCKVIMTGGFGNMTISYGDLFENLYLMLRHWKIVEIIKQLFCLAEKEGLNKKKLLFTFLKKLIGKNDDSDEWFIDEVYFKKELVDKYSIKEIWSHKSKIEGKTKKSSAQRRRFIVSGSVLQLIGMYQTKDSLYHGILTRDPSRDKRMIELCLKLPYKCFAWNGTERRLVRDYLDDIVPDEIRLVNKKRGRQSGDAVIRFDTIGLPDGNKTWDALIDKLSEYFNMDEAKRLLKSKSDDKNIIIKTKILSCNYFLKEYGI